MITRALCSAPGLPRDAVDARAGNKAGTQSGTDGLIATAKRWWLAYIVWRMERAATGRLWSMTDRELKDIGLTRMEIVSAVRGELARARALDRR
jgi:uncharacterized protein YjiS (DUF1127 family)